MSRRDRLNPSGSPFPPPARENTDESRRDPAASVKAYIGRLKGPSEPLGLQAVDPTDARIAPYPFLFLTGFRDPRLTNEEVSALQRHLQAGGFLFINNCSGYQAFDRHARALLTRRRPGVPNLGDVRTGVHSSLWTSVEDAVRVLRPQLVVVGNVAARLRRRFVVVHRDLAARVRHELAVPTRIRRRCRPPPRPTTRPV